VATEQKRFLLDNENKEKYYLINYINENENQNNNQLGLTPTLIINKIDGQLIVRSDEDFDKKINLKKEEIKRIEILSIEKSIALYGSAGTNGVISIYTYGKPK
jgi:hypothetical protein